MDSQVRYIEKIVFESGSPSASRDLPRLMQRLCRRRAWLIRTAPSWGLPKCEDRSSSYTASTKGVTCDLVVEHHRRRALQALMAVDLALRVDRGLAEFDVRTYQSTFWLFFCLDFYGMLNTWVKCRTITLSARMFGQENIGAEATISASGREVASQLRTFGVADWFWNEDMPLSWSINRFQEPEELYAPAVNFSSWVAGVVEVPPGFDISFDGQAIMDVESPDSYVLALLGYGAIGRLCRSYCAPRRQRHGQAWERWLTLAQDIAYVKRMMPPAETWEVEKATVKHRKVLSTVHAPVHDDAHWVSQHRVEVRHWITAMVDECFSDTTFRPSEPVPSTHACVERSGVTGGALVDLFLQTEDSRSAAMNQPMGSELDRLVEVQPGVIRELRKRDRAQRQLEEFSREVSRRCDELRRDNEGLNPFSPEAARAPYHVDVLPAAVVEPCKVRMITMGPACLYQRALALQKFLWGTMKRVKMFQWIGKPISAEDYEDAIPADYVANWLACDDNLTLVSGDYSGATDNLDPEISLWAINAIADKVYVDVGDGVGWEPIPGRPLSMRARLGRPLLRDTIWYDILVATLIGHTLHHGERRSEVLENREAAYLLGDDSWRKGVLQLWGQLMGAPCSFPVLNLVNAAHTCAVLGPPTPEFGVPCGFQLSGTNSQAWASFWRAARQFIRVNPCCIATNGDDIQFVCSSLDYDLWVASGRSIGLEPSPGKNLTSRSFLQMNSEMRVLCECEGPLLEDQRARPHVWRLNSFLNQPLLCCSEAKGSHAGTSQLARIPYFSIGARARSLVAGCDPDLTSRRLHWWQRFHQPLLDRCPPGMIWECPEQLGGLGVPRYRDIDPPQWALRRCAYLACLDTRSRLKETTPPRATEVCPWLRGLATAMSRGLEVERVVDPPPNEVWWDPSPVKGAGSPGAVLANFLSDWSPEDGDTDESSDGLYIRFPLREGDVKPAKPIWAKYLAQDRVEVLQTAILEMKHRRRYGKTSRLAVASPLHPMRPDHLEQWSDRRQLVREVLQPAYDPAVRLE